MKWCEGLHKPCDEHEDPDKECRQCPPLIDGEVCDGCKRRLRRSLDRLITDYCLLYAWIGSPIRRHNSDGQPRTAGAKVFGHPAEWASDTMRRIALALWSWEDAVRDHLDHSPVPSPGRGEPRIIAASFTYLTNQFETFADFPGTLAALKELADLHGKLYSDLGRSREIRKLPTTCPDCGSLSLLWSVDFGEDQITCQTQGCGRRIEPKHYLLYARILLDDLLDAIDAQPVGA